MNGKVIFVGAGSGSADLLTLRAVRCLERADVVLHDDLVARDVLDFVPPTAVMRNVGKRCGRPGISQEALNGLMIEHARRGRNVVRLKCGDPGMFGRLGEEIDALREARIAFEIVPGVTAGLAAAAAAQITLTDRRSASRVVFAAASLAGGKRQEWAKIADADATLVIYMPGQDYAALGSELLAAGVAHDLPCTIISNAGSIQECIAGGTVADLAEQRTVAVPAIVIVGPQVRIKRERRAQEFRMQEKVPPRIEVGH
jgi:uroporphyrin-III C-methyltransferase